MIVAGFGHPKSLKFMQLAFTNGDVTKGDYEAALRACQRYLESVRSDQRDEAAAFDDHDKYLIDEDDY